MRQEGRIGLVRSKTDSYWTSEMNDADVKWMHAGMSRDLELTPTVKGTLFVTEK